MEPGGLPSVSEHGEALRVTGLVSLDTTPAALGSYLQSRILLEPTSCAQAWCECRNEPRLTKLVGEGVPWFVIIADQKPILMGHHLN